VLWTVNESWRLVDAPVHPARRIVEPLSSDNDDAVLESNVSSGRTNSVWITCCPTQHWASRTFFDRNYRLWCSFAVVFDDGLANDQHKNTFFFAGDSAMPTGFPLFEQIGDYVGPIHLSALPIGAYLPDYYMREAHMNPEEAVQVHRKLQSLCSVGIHWGSFPLSEEPMDEPPRWLAETIAREPQVSAPFGIIPHGGRLEVVCGSGIVCSEAPPGASVYVEGEAASS